MFPPGGGEGGEASLAVAGGRVVTELLVSGMELSVGPNVLLV